MSSFKVFALAFLNAAKDDTILAALPILGTAAANAAKNPSQENAVAQAAGLLPALLVAVPNLEGELIALTAGFIAQEASALVTQAGTDLAAQTATLLSLASTASSVAGTATKSGA